jgi:molybdopterin-guanine dinucleotide biosynthesis protein A
VISIPDATAFILAGGRSSRMGTDKAFLRLGNQTLLERAVATAKRVCRTVVLVGDADKLSVFGRAVGDKFPGQGPLAGIHAALTSSFASELNLMLSVDIPVVSAEFLNHLLRESRSSNAQVLVQRAGGHLQTLCAVYHRQFAEIAEPALREGRNKIELLFAEIATRILEEDEMKALGFSPDIFDNVNTPEDWRRMKLRLGEKAE